MASSVEERTGLRLAPSLAPRRPAAARPAPARGRDAGRIALQLCLSSLLLAYLSALGVLSIRGLVWLVRIWAG